MAVNRFEAVHKLRELEGQLAGVVYAKEDFGRWVKDVESTLEFVLPEQLKLHQSFTEATIPTESGHDVQKLREVLARARSLLFLETDDETDSAFAETVRHSVNDLYMQSWVFRIPALILGIAALLFIGASYQVLGYKFDLDEEAEQIYEDMRREATTVKSTMEQEKDQLLREIAGLTDRIKSTITQAELDAQKRLGSLDSTIGEQRDLIVAAADREIEGSIPSQARQQAKRIEEAVSLAIVTELPKILNNANETVGEAADKAIEQTFNPHVRSEMQRLTDTVTAIIAKELREHSQAEQARISDAVTVYLSNSLPEHLAAQERRVSVAVDTLVAADLQNSVERASEQVVTSARGFIDGPLADELETQKRAISSAASDWISGALTAHAALEEQRLTAEADRLRKTLWVSLGAKLSELLLDEFRGEVEHLESPVNHAQDSRPVVEGAAGVADVIDNPKP